MDYEAAWLRAKFRGVYQIDINVSYGELGSIFHPEPGTAVGDLTEKVSTTYGSVFSSLSTNGTTGSNVLMIGTALANSRHIVISRNSHSSIYGALTVFDAVPYYVSVQLDPRFGIPIGPSVDDVLQVLDRAADAEAVALTTPNYFGVVAPIRDLVREVHAHGKRILIDGAHGGHFRATPLLPEPIEAAAPDIITQSIHKVGGALGQASLLHVYSSDPELKGRFFEVLNAIPVLSTSFSVPILASIEVAVEELADRSRWDRAVNLAGELRNWLNRVDGCQVVHFQVPQPAVATHDPTRICVDVGETGISGHRFAELLYDGHRSGPGGHTVRQVAEMATQRHVLFILTSATSRAATQRLAAAFERVVRDHGRRGAAVPALQVPSGLPPMILTPRQAFDARPARRRRLPVAEAARAGCVAAETVAVYPPGAPIFVAGEQLRVQDVEYLQQARASGATLKGASDASFETLTVIDI